MMPSPCMSLFRVSRTVRPTNLLRRIPLRRMRWLGTGFALVASQLAAAATITPVTVQRPEGERHYLLATPATPVDGKRPLIVLLHGHTGSAEQALGQRRSAAPMSVWLQIADREGLLIAVPDGEKGGDDKQGWNDCRSDTTTNPKTDDVGLIRAILDKEIAEHHADPARVFVMGMSNGGMMAFRAAAELGDRLAGFAAVSASMAAQSRCPAPKASLSALIAGGTADPLVPYAGGDVKFLAYSARGSVIGTEQSAEIWRQVDGLPSTPHSTTLLPHLHEDDSTHATRTIWGEDPKKPQVELLRIEQGGHVEPSSAQRVSSGYTMLLGPQNGDVEMAEEAWAFFKDKRLAAKP